MSHSGTRPAQRASGVVIVFGASIFASAFLIFLVQPMVGKQIVPWFGGTTGVWTLCLAFYQSSLFLGYAYAHLLIGWVPPFRQLAIHALLFALAFALLPVLPGEFWKPLQSSEPNARILAMLVANVALPFVMLAATGPLLQAWFANTVPGRSPYPLYALSNFGSLLALLAYPFFIEPHLPLSLNSKLWSVGFALCGAGVICCAWLAARHSLGAPRTVSATDGQTQRAAGRVSGKTRALWILLPACAVVLFMGVSNKLTLDVASVPFLWVVPLCIYLLTFILCFGSERLYPRGVVLGLALILAGLFSSPIGQSLLSPGQAASPSLYGQIAAYTALLFVCCMLLHGELYRLRPPPESLTSYYLCISGGGAAGGLFVGLLAPRIFADYSELPLGLAVGWSLLVTAWWRDPTSLLRIGHWRQAWTSAACLSLALCLGATTYFQASGSASGRGHVKLQQRNFYGILRVKEEQRERPPRSVLALQNGTTTHGYQFSAPALRSVATGYYSRLSGVGLALTRPGQARERTVGFIGLGIGTLAAYGQPGDSFRYFEIDPDVVRIANDKRYFSYLHDSQAEIEIVEGDGRLALEAELLSGEAATYDVLVLDAFTSDSIPVHLLTLEAFELYKQRLSKTGLLAVHISSRHLLLGPLVYRLGKAAGLEALIVLNLQNDLHHATRSKWVVLSHQASTLERVRAFGFATKRRLSLSDRELIFFKPTEDEIAKAPIWTDDYSDVLSVVKHKRWF